MELEVPLVFAKGFPASLNSLSEPYQMEPIEAQLKCFLNYLWDFTKVPKSSQSFPEDNLRPQEGRIELLRQAVRNVYKRLGCSYLLSLSEGIAQCNDTSLLFNVDSQLGVVTIWNKRYCKVIAKIPQSNLTYDLNLELSESKSPKKKETQLARGLNGVTLQTLDKDKTTNIKSNFIYNNIITIDESDSEVLEISDEEEPKKSSPSLNQNLKDSNVIEIVDDDSQVEQLQAQEPEPCTIRCEKVWSVSANSEIIEVSDSDEETNNAYSEEREKAGELLSKLLISHHSKGQLPSRGKRRKTVTKRRHPSPSTVQPEGPSPLPDQETFLYYFGLYDPHNLPDDPIILPELKKCDFVKFHRLPLNTVPFLANQGLIDKSVLNPGPPGQNSKYVSTSDNLLDKRRNVRTASYRLAMSRFKSMDLENARDYKYPTKTFRTVHPAPLPKRKTNRPLPDPPHDKISTTLVSSNYHRKFKLKECSVRLVKLNPIILKKYYIKKRW